MKPIAESVDRLNDIVGRIHGFQLLTNISNVTVNGAVTDLYRFAISRIHQLVSGFDNTGMLGQREKEQTLGHC